MPKQQNILVVDDDKAVTTSLQLLLKQAGYQVRAASSPSQALSTAEQQAFDLIIQDMNFSRRTSGSEGLALLVSFKQKWPALPVVLITAWGSVELAVKGIKAGAADFITKPWSNEQILQTVRTTLGLIDANRDSDQSSLNTRAQLDQQYDFSGIIGETPEFLKILDIVGRVSKTDAPVLITGENGVGKEIIADAIWRNSVRKDKPFVKVNLAGLPTTLFESEMFGHVKGAFTGAHTDRAGRFEASHEGTIFLDEIGDLTAGSQVKLLRVLQDRTFEKVGSSKSQTVDVRVLSATNRELEALISEGTFREDLFYRLNLIRIHVPPLRKRRNDIPLLATTFLQNIGRRYQRTDAQLAPDALDWLSTQTWPGNVRQLRQTVERAILLGSGTTITADDLEHAVDMHQSPSQASAFPAPGSMSLEEMEKKMILNALQEFEGHITRTAEALGISRNALYRRLEKYGIDS